MKVTAMEKMILFLTQIHTNMLWLDFICEIYYFILGDNNIWLATLKDWYDFSTTVAVAKCGKVKFIAQSIKYQENVSDKCYSVITFWKWYIIQLAIL